MDSQYLTRAIRLGKTFSNRMHNLLQFWNVIESIATFTVELSVLELLLVGGESFWVEAPVRNRRSVRVNVGSSPYETICISKLDLRRRSIISSGSRLSGDCQNMKDNTTAKSNATHSTLPEFINYHQVDIVNEHHVGVRCSLDSLRQNQAHIRNKDRT